jgi:hypothetical protein
MVRLYAAHLSDLGHDDFVHVECACVHLEHLTVTMLTISPYTKLRDLQHRLKCRECRWKGRAVVSVRWVQRREQVLTINNGSEVRREGWSAVRP